MHIEGLLFLSMCNCSSCFSIKNNVF